MYVADMGCGIARILSRNKLKIPYYSEMAGQRKAKTDTRSGQEIVDSIIARRRKKRAARGGENH